MSKVKYLAVINKSESYRLEVSDISYISRNSRRIIFNTDDGVIKTYSKMDQIEDVLGPEFARCMSSCIINMTKIKELKDNTVYFQNGEKLKLGRDTYIRLKQKYNAYLLGLIPGLKPCK